MTDLDPVAAGRAALEAGRWEEARAAFAAALAEEETAEALDGMGAALWWLGETRASVAHTERAYAEFRRAGDAVPAALAAISLCVTWFSNFDNHAAAGGWLARPSGSWPRPTRTRCGAGSGWCAPTWNPTLAAPRSSTSGPWSWRGPPATWTWSCVPSATSG